MWKNWLLWGLAMVSSLFFASNYGGTVPYTFVYLLIAMPFVSFFYTLFVFFRFRFLQSAGQKMMVKGELVDYRFQLSNEDFFLYSSIKVDFFSDKSTILAIDEKKEYTLLPGEKEDFRTKMCCHYRGEYWVGAKSFIITDFLGLFRIKYAVESKLPALVSPRIIPFSYSDLIKEEEDEKETQFRIREQSELDQQVREYVPGDSIRQIHWKNSAKTGKLMSRTYQAIQRQQVCILLDLSKIRREEKERFVLEDEMLEQAIAAASYCCDHKIPCSVFLFQNGWKEFKIHTQKEFHEFYEFCITVVFGEEKGFEKLILEVLYKKRGSHLILITTNMEQDISTAMLKKTQDDKVSMLFVTTILEAKQKHIVGELEKRGISIRLISVIPEEV